MNPSQRDEQSAASLTLCCSAYEPQFFRTTNVTGKFACPKEQEMVMPGDNAIMFVDSPSAKAAARSARA
jgi:translation elongation factor EF-Tu-like GTPase